MKISFITTVYNEQETIEQLLDSLLVQSKLPDEVIIVDGGSSDETVKRIKNYELRIKNKNIKFKIFIKKGNRSIGRNEAIKHSIGDIIVCTDAGNILDKNWIKNITKPFKDKTTDVVAGYYKGKPSNIFQKSLIPFVLVMPDRVNPKDFLPATRSIAFRKSIWKEIGGFPEKYSHNEDYVFANNLKSIKANIILAKDAIVYWIPRNSLKSAFVMFFRFALGDIEAKILRPKVLLLFARYLLGAYFLFLSIFYKSLTGLIFLLLLIVGYKIWSIYKNYRYVKNIKAIYYLPLLQFTSDLAVLSGSVIGFFKLITKFNYLQYIKKNKILFITIFVYAFLLLLTIRWGIPNQNHPFPYHMDEWHQLQAVANTFRYGTPNMFGSANGTMFHFLYSGLYLLPFWLLQIINPFELQIDNFNMRERVFIVLRLQTIIFGIFSIYLMYLIAQLLNSPRKLTILLFTFTPIWLMLGGYFKYDIALIFWILLSLYFMLKFARTPNLINYLITAVSSGLAIAVKVSAIPLVPIYVLSFILFFPKWFKNIKILLLGLLLLFLTVILFGAPDTLFGKGDIRLYLYENILQVAPAANNFELGLHPLLYLVLWVYPMIFGHGFLLLSLLSFSYWLFVFGIGFRKHKLNKHKTVLFIILCTLIIIASLLPLLIFAGGNRSLVLLPFLTILICLMLRDLYKYKNIKKTISLFLTILIIFQIYLTLNWINLKLQPSPQEISSEWIKKNIPKGSVIGLENIPIYQGIPDILQKEFYYSQYKIKFNKNYQYRIIDSKTKKLPEYIVISSHENEYKYVNNSPKNELIRRIKKEGYKRIYFYKLDPNLSFPLIKDREYFFSWIGLAPQTMVIYIK